MLKSIFTTALRNILRNKTFSVINFFGLSVSMSLALLIILIIKDQHSYDDFHSEANHIYRVNTRVIRVDDARSRYASAPLQLGTLLEQNYSFVEKVVRIDRQLSGDVEFGNTIVPISGFFVDASFFDVFNFKLSEGNASKFISEANSLILTQKARKKIFGDGEALGKTVTIKGMGDFLISGILEEFPSKSHFDFEVLASTAILPSLESRGSVMRTLSNWDNYNTGYVYFKCTEVMPKSSIDRALGEIASSIFDESTRRGDDQGFEFYAQSLDEITPGPELENQMGTALPSMVSNFFIVLAALVVLMASFNYTNMMIAKSLARAREIGIRKAIGAQRFQIFLQFVGEAIVFSLISLVFSYVIMQLISPAFMQLHLTSEFTVNLEEDFTVCILFVSFAVLVGVIAGLLPAIYLSAFKAIKVLRGSGATRINPNLSFRKILMITQFMMSSVFVMVILIINKQANFMISTDYGFDEKSVIDIRLNGNDPDKLGNRVRGLSGVEKVGFVSQIPGTWESHTGNYKSVESDKFFGVRDYFVDENYLNVIKLNFRAGSGFEFFPNGQASSKVIINESSLALFELPSAHEAIGKSIIGDDSVEFQIVGVVEDFHFTPLNSKIAPLVIRYGLEDARFLSIRVRQGGEEEVKIAVAQIWEEMDPIHPLELEMMSVEIDDAYTLSGFMDLVTIVGYISVILSVIACLGMLAMAMYNTKTRTKEIGIRKVLGASTIEIVLILSRSFFLMVSFAMVIGLPLGLYLGDAFISSYAYRVEITFGLLLLGTFILAFLGIFTIASQTVHASNGNPVHALRHE